MPTERRRHPRFQESGRSQRQHDHEPEQDLGSAILALFRMTAPACANGDDDLTGYPAEIKHAPDYRQLATSELTHTEERVCLRVLPPSRWLMYGKSSPWDIVRKILHFR